MNLRFCHCFCCAPFSAGLCQNNRYPVQSMIVRIVAGTAYVGKGNTIADLFTANQQTDTHYHCDTSARKIIKN